MKNHKFLFALVFLLAFAACKKQDHEMIPASETLTSAADWKSGLNWTAQEDSSAYSSSIADPLITSSVVTKGLVLVYKKEGERIAALPVAENGKTWFYQVFDGGVDIFYKAASGPDARAAYRYIVLDPEMLDKLEKQQHSRAELLTLPYQKVLELLK